mmetsp:Transcript_26686/g.39648  ORF Transcript_26686/g.39648 Transcript_26686/m.39648 type:complete len:162 (+) Transcript_26686:95-580(+)|eukprot:CAMPEP_0185018540 /NCGR_PEP_ID=MMETSP1103-20130426/1228_1 /TAXON_ID=36769 /ORGANISM="Paraphysomonas bandaiensis, Strain Caron Lab Isolate" /LENGTH=161 /DNA_ID=CAMNT_0027548381 /DNA_START=75 /DNA_END=560 /DNA_ORIENTATION=+
MTIYALKIKANLDNVARMIPLNNNMWKFDIVSNGGERREGITVTTADEIDLEGSRGHANFVMKWPGTHHQSYIKIVDLKKCSGIYTAEDAAGGKFVPILGLECRGLEIERWVPEVDFVVETADGTIFEDVDLSDSDGWAEYDEENDAAVSITELESVIERV